MSPSFPKPDAAAKAYFESLLPGSDRRVVIKPMFGNLAAFINGQMFAGLFGNAVFVRLDAAGRTELLTEPGAVPFEPMKGRAMKEYVELPAAWRNTSERTRTWLDRSLAWAATLPAKKTAKTPRARAIKERPRR
jgi:TfoX/Sxy family transcriptional regulator of competence genes